jgi:hypothetical protein
MCRRLAQIKNLKIDDDFGIGEAGKAQKAERFAKLLDSI